jgi:hypothetical protein
LKRHAQRIEVMILPINPQAASSISWPSAIGSSYDRTFHVCASRSCLILFSIRICFSIIVGKRRSNPGQAVAARVDTRVGARVDSRTRTAAHSLPDAEILLRPGIRVGTRRLWNLGHATALHGHIVAGLLELLGEGRTLAQHGSLPVNHVDGHNQRKRDTD